MSAPAVFDPFAPGFADDPHPHYARLRAGSPVHRHPLGFWILSGYDDVAALQRAPHSVDEKNLVHRPAWKNDPAGPGKANRPMLGLSMLDRDPPEHTRLRRLVAATFTRRAVEAWGPRIEALVDDALDRIADAGGGDVVAELAFPLPFTVVSLMLGIPVVEQARVRELSGTLVRALEPLVGAELHAQIRAANHELTQMLREIVVWKRSHPGDDLLTALLTADDDGDVLGEDELVAQIMLLYVAGHETTVNLVANGVLALARHPEQLRRLHADPGLAAPTVEEVLRHDPPVQLMRRITVEPLLVRDEEIPAGSFVLAALAAANRDPDAFGPDADEFRMDRPDAHRNLSFGAGVHHCLGAGLARLEARAALGRFAARFPSVTVEDLEWNGRINLRGPARLEIAVR
ncbi:MAG: cytochrome P450 [Pseudonocardia sediminis]